MISIGVTQTGQPGPCTSSMCLASSSSSPYRRIVCVWPPQISMSTHGCVVAPAIFRARARAMRASRYSSMYFISRSLGKRSDLFQNAICSRRFVGIYSADREAHMHHHEVAHLSFRNEIQADVSDNTAELHASLAKFAHSLFAKDLSWNSQAHNRS